MRKSFTRLFSIFLLIAVFVLQGFAISVFPDLEPSSTFANHKKTNTLVLTASEKVVAGVGVIRLKEGETTKSAYQATNPNVTITENADGTAWEIVVNFTSLLEEGKSYTLEADANFVKAADDGVASSFNKWTVNVGDYTAPLLATTSALSPANGASSVQLGQDLTVTFNEGVKVATDQKVYIYEENGTAFGNLFDVVEGSVIGTVLTIHPNKAFVGLAKYYVVIPNGTIVDDADGFGNDNKNKFAGWLNNTTWAFTTRDIVAPELTKIVKDNVAKDAFDVFVQLNKKGKVYLLAVPKDQAVTAADFTTAAAGVATATVTVANTDVKVSLTQFFNGTSVINMAEAGTYEVWVMTENTETVAPNQSAPAKKLLVTTSDVTKPVVTTLYPLTGAPASDINTKDYLTVKLSEKVKLGTGSINVYSWNGLNHELLVSVPASSGKVSKLSGVTENDSLYIPVAKSLWVSQATYYVNYTEGIVTDLSGNKLASLSNTEGWKFTVADFVAPTYTIVPLNGAAAASQVGPQVTITFNEAIYKDALGAAMDVIGINAALSLKKGTSAALFTSAISGNVVTLTITAVASKDAFELSIDTKKIFDATGNKGTTVDKINFTIKDFEAPVVTIEPLAPGKADNILVKFSEPVLNADGSAVTDANVANIVIFRKGTSASGAIVSATYTVAADAKSFIIDPTNDFTAPGDQYFVRIGAGAVKDAAGNTNALKEEIITVADFIAPTATFSGIGTSPVNPGSVAAVITFTEAMLTLAEVAVTGNATALVNLKENGENIAFTATWTSSTTITVVPTVAYGYNKTYTISVGKSLQDVNDNLFQGVSTTFTTWSNVAPAMVSVSPATNSTEQANNSALQVTFDQPIATGTGSITFAGTTGSVGTVTVNGAVLNIAHTTFVTDETITVTIPAGYVKGLNGIDAPAVSWTFKTHETVLPTVSIYAPAIASTTAGISDKLTLTFSEKIVKKTGQILIKDFTTDVTVQTLTEANTVVKSDNQLEITATAALVYGKKYYVVVTPGFIEDLAGNKYAGISDNTWNFTATATPGVFTVSSSVPANETDKIAAGISSITVTFNRDIKVGSLSATNKITLNDGTANVITDIASSSRFSISGNTLTINTLTDVVANKVYTLTLDAGIVKDNFNTDNTAKTIVFYTKDNNAPKVASHTPAKDAVNVPVNSTIVLTWDETPSKVADGSAITAANIKANSFVTVNGATNYTASVNGLQWTITLDAALAEKALNTVAVDLAKVKDVNGIVGAGTYSWSFTTIDATCNAPSVLALTENTKGTEVKFTVKFDEKGTVYYAVLPATSVAPSAADIKALNQTIAYTAAATSAAKTVIGLTSAASYKAYFVAVDESSNTSTIFAPASFTTADVVAPVVITMVPVKDATGVAANAKLVLTFDEAVVLGAGSVVIREVATDIIVEELSISSANTVLSNGAKTATITRTVALASQKAYYVEVSTGAFADGALNKVAAISGSANWAFTTKDTVLPLLVKTAPDHTASPIMEIVGGTTLSIEFNEAMKVATGVVYVKYVTDNSVFEVIDANALTLSADKKTFSFKMTHVPAEQTSFFIDLKDLSLKDLADNEWIKTPLATNEWNFAILDQTAPSLASSVPANNATGIQIASAITLTFSENIFKSPDATAFDNTTIKSVLALKNAAGVAVAFSATITGNVVIVTPSANLKSETKYTLSVSPVVDNRKNISSEKTVVFTTKDNTLPFVSVWSPLYDTKMNPTTGVVTATFNEPIYDDVVITSEYNTVVVEVLNANIADFFTYKVGTITRDGDNKIASFTAGTDVAFTGTISIDKKTIVLTPAATALPLASETWYQVTLKAGVVEDVAENANIASTENSTIFQILDHQKPLAVVGSYLPTGATADDAEMKVTFSEPVKLGVGNFYIRNYVDGTVVETIAVNANNVTVTGSSVVIKHADFPAGKNFFVNVDSGAITDLAGNGWNGIATSAIGTWKFSTADAVEPVLFAEGALSPAIGSTNVGLNAELQIIFSKVIAKNTGNIIIYNEDWTPFEVIPVSSVTLKAFTDPVYQSNRVASISHAPFAENAKYFVRVETNTFKDVAGNLFAGLLDNTWSFTTEDNSDPSILSLAPADNSTDISAYADLTMTFESDVLANAAGKIYVYEEVGSTGVLVETISTTDATKVVVNGNVVSIDRSEVLKYNAKYYVIVEAGAFTNIASEKKPFAGITTTLGWSFTTAVTDVDNPTLVTKTPNQITIADNYPTFVMTFSEDVVIGTGNLKVIKVGATVPSLTIPITAAMVSGKVVTVSYIYNATTGGLDKNTDYYVLVEGSALTDVAGNKFAGVSDVAAWTFKTGLVWVTKIDTNPNSSEFKVYPNPFVDVVNLISPSGLSKVVVTNIAGQVVKEVVNPANSIQLNELGNGIYFISLYNMDNVIAKTAKIVKR